MSEKGSLASFLSGRRRMVEDALDALLPAADVSPERLHEAMRYSVFSGGKRLRPILAVAACELLGGPIDAVLAPACALELIHTYSLIHDDLPAMDDDDLRRGRPTCHRAFGEPMAILAGDALLTLAFEIVASAEMLAPDCRTAVLLELARANGSLGMVGGQAADIEAEGGASDLDAVTFIHVRKTAMPLRAAVRVGALVAGAAPGELDALSSYGEAVGLAFQIADDLLDVAGTAEEMGKAVGKDAARGKLTYPGAVGRKAATLKATELVGDATASLAGFGERAGPLLDIAGYVVDRRS